MNKNNLIAKTAFAVAWLIVGSFGGELFAQPAPVAHWTFDGFLGDFTR